MKRLTLTASLLTIAQLGAVQAAGQNRWVTDCHRLRAVAATELPGAVEQSFSFQGPCTLSQGTPGNLAIVGQVQLRVEAIWTPGSGEFHESVASDSAPYRGYVILKLHCDRNPLLERADCSRLEYSNTTGWREFDDFKYKARPVSMGRADPDDLLALLHPGGGRNPTRTIGPAVRTATAASHSGPVPTPDSLPVEIALSAGTRVPLEDQRIVAALEENGEVRWTILGRDGTTILRRYPDGVRMLRTPGNEILVDWGGVVLKLGTATTNGRNSP